jgi:hypothetical protein
MNVTICQYTFPIVEEICILAWNRECKW